jgi:hypothetical protein
MHETLKFCLYFLVHGIPLNPQLLHWRLLYHSDDLKFIVHFLSVAANRNGSMGVILCRLEGERDSKRELDQE